MRALPFQSIISHVARLRIDRHSGHQARSLRRDMIIEDDVLVALDIQQAFEHQGARTTTTRTVAAALLAIEDPSLAAAIVDHALGDGDSSVLCQRLKERDVPFITYSGHTNIDGACAGTMHLTKPTSGSLLVSTVKDILAQRQI